MLWIGILLLMLLGVIIVINSKLDNSTKYHFIIFIVLGLTLRIVLAKMDFTFTTDINTFKYWSMDLARNGASGFYTRGFFADYSPGYLYVLWLMGIIGGLTAIVSNPLDFTILIMIPAMVFDILLGLLIYWLALKKTTRLTAFCLAAAYVFNPAVLINSSIWGQVDAVYTLVGVLSIYLLTKKNYLPAFLLFALNITIKPQALILTPIYLFCLYRIFKDKVYSPFRICKLFLYPLGLILLLCLPFTVNFNLLPVINQYISTLGQYSTATFNAYNFYALFGANAVSAKEIFVLMPYSFYGILSLILIVALSFYLLAKKSLNYFFVAALLYILTFMFSIKMHERYVFPALAFLIFTYLFIQNKHILLLFACFSVTLFLNCLDILICVYTFSDIFNGALLPYVSLLNVIFVGYVIFVTRKSVLST